ncbi:MAG TPA: hypothetical protein VFN56_05110 [Candidatus Saccharimonadales bacterium]|nr:hypothetical protein [Candidatus Saccharimonadales bacterium]
MTTTQYETQPQASTRYHGIPLLRYLLSTVATLGIGFGAGYAHDQTNTKIDMTQVQQESNQLRDQLVFSFPTLSDLYVEGGHSFSFQVSGADQAKECHGSFTSDPTLYVKSVGAIVCQPLVAGQ